MLKDGEVVGVINLYRQDVRPFITAQAVIATENARLLNELRSRTDELARSVGELRALGEVSQAVNLTLDLQTVLSTIVAVQLAGAEAAFAQESAKLFPVRLDDTPLPLRFIHVHTLNLSDWDGSAAHASVQALVAHLVDAIGRPAADDGV